MEIEAFVTDETVTVALLSLAAALEPHDIFLRDVLVADAPRKVPYDKMHVCGIGIREVV